MRSSWFSKRQLILSTHPWIQTRAFSLVRSPRSCQIEEARWRNFFFIANNNVNDNTTPKQRFLVKLRGKKYFLPVVRSLLRSSREQNTWYAHDDYRRPTTTFELFQQFNAKLRINTIKYRHCRRWDCGLVRGQKQLSFKFFFSFVFNVSCAFRHFSCGIVCFRN